MYEDDEWDGRGMNDDTTVSSGIIASADLGVAGLEADPSLDPLGLLLSSNLDGKGAEDFRN